jgi:hypothetical protein
MVAGEDWGRDEEEGASRMTPEAISSMMDKPVTREEVNRDYPIVAEFVDYIRWLADQNTSFTVSVGDLWQLYHDGVRKCKYWSEVCEDIGLPVRDDWS